MQTYLPVLNDRIGMARRQRVRLADGGQTYTVVGADYSVVAPVEDWLEDLRVNDYSPNTIAAWATAAAAWFTFLEHRGEADEWHRVGLKTVSAFVGWLGDGSPPPGVSPLRADAGRRPERSTVQARLDAILGFYRYHRDVHGVDVANRLYRPSRGSRHGRGLLSHLDDRRPASESPRIKRRGSKRRDRAPVLTPTAVGEILEAAATWDATGGRWSGNLRDRLLFATLVESGVRLGEALNLVIDDWHMGRGGTPYLHIVPRDGDRHDARVKSGRERRVYVSPELDQLYSDYLVELVDRAAQYGVEPDGAWPLFVNMDREPRFAPLRASTVYDKVDRLRDRGVGPADWTPHWFRHTHATALLLTDVPDWVVSRRLGHAHVQTTLDLYGWVTEDAALRATANWRQFAAGWPVDEELADA